MQRRPLKLLLHDYSGHAFTAQLARGLARRGMDISYASFSEFGTPKGRTGRAAADPVGFRSHEISFDTPFDKDNLVRRYQQQQRYARSIAEHARRVRPDIVLSGNSPLEVQQHLMRAADEVGAGFVFWLQDINAEAIGRILGRRNRLLGSAAGLYYKRMERDLLRRSDRIVAIADDFVDLLGGAWGLDTSRMMVVENWAPLEDIPLHPRDNAWTVANFRAGRKRIVYSGTLARKHDPEILVQLAERTDADVYLFSEGSGAEHVRARVAEAKLGNLFVKPWVGVDDLPMMLAGADILCAFIEPDAGVFSVPSKVLTYLAAGRPILASIPRQNLAARTILRAGAGLVSQPGEMAAMLADAQTLLDDEALRRRLGQGGRAYAETHFDIDHIAARFEQIMSELHLGGSAVRRDPVEA
jgi:glycosyltransferase involved in cell wall biosynthesis